MNGFRDRQTTDMSSYGYNVNRRLMERDSFNQSSSKSDRNDDHDKYGEITGEYMELPPIDKGMPMRSNIVSSVHHALPYDNTYLDFDLYREKPNIKVSSFNQYNLQFSNLNDIDQPILKSSQPMEIIKSSNIFTFDFIEKFVENSKLKKSIVLSPHLIMQSFCLLYIGSKNKTENLLKNYFNFPNKQYTHTNLYKINQELANSNILSYLNIICFPNNLTINEAYTTFINRIGYFLPFDQNSPHRDTQNVNKMILQTTNGAFGNFIQPQMLENNNLVTINISYIYSKWKFSFNPANTRSEIFYGLSKSQVQMMSQAKVTHNYFEDAQNQILEMDYINDSFSMGFILPKNKYIEPIITHDQYNYYVSNLKTTCLSLVRIPKFKIDSRYSISNLFKKYGLKDIFQYIDISEIIPPMNNNQAFVTDIIHASIIEINESGSKSSLNLDIPPQNIEFIANHQFMYYIRYKPYNLVLFIGQYYGSFV
ncbi:serpin [Indivirus ILV1]|uniref:Serpin n=1 Tax=Indivirus ILV1 TaxID=1977633 RepID=A0A1V0SCH2_9VIRU|nr:serpin [Indivirus ILV1]